MSRTEHYEKRTNEAVARKVGDGEGVVLKCDGSAWRGRGGYAVVRKVGGKYETVSSGRMLTNSSNEMERRAVLAAIEWAEKETDGNVLIMSDCKGVVEEIMLKNKSQVSSALHRAGKDSVLRELREKVRGVHERVCVEWVPRKKVRPADNAAKRERRKMEAEAREGGQS